MSGAPAILRKRGADPAHPSSERRRGFFLGSAGVRFAAIYTGLLAISAGALAMFLWWATAGLLDRQVEAAIRGDARGLAERWDEGGVSALVLTIEDRLAGNVDDDAIYLLTDAQMQPLAGNLAHWPEPVQRTDGWYELQVQRAGIRSLARVHRYDLPNGYHLLVGRDVRNRAQLRQLLTDALLWAMLVVAAMATIGGLIVRSLFHQEAMILAATEFDRMAAQLQTLTPRDWAQPTVCQLWDVRAMAAHVLGMAEAQASFRQFAHDFHAAGKRTGGKMMAKAGMYGPGWPLRQAGRAGSRRPHRARSVR